MSKNQSTRGSALGRMISKFFVSAFVVFTFAAYAVHERIVNPDGGIAAIAPTEGAVPTEPVAALPQVMPTDSQLVFATPPAVPAALATTKSQAIQVAQATPKPAATPTAKAKGAYKDGAYTGPEIDAFYGLVRVKAVIQNGKITDVQFLEYPSDRRTSVRINTIAMPYLKTEAIQAQSARVNIISGATLTSEAFAQSLQSALNTAKN